MLMRGGAYKYGINSSRLITPDAGLVVIQDRLKVSPSTPDYLMEIDYRHQLR
jgi:hypothetical protein